MTTHTKKTKLPSKQVLNLIARRTNNKWRLNSKKRKAIAIRTQKSNKSVKKAISKA